MKLLFASDSFKGTLSSDQIIKLLNESAQRIFPGCETVGVPVADGGEGTVDAVIAVTNGDYRKVKVHGPLMEETEASYGVFHGDSAIIEMAAASGLPMVPTEKRNPLNTTTYGTGELIKDALDHGYRKLSIAIGGSATNDGGCGCAAALGTGFYDIHGNRFIPTGATLEQIETIRVPDGWTLPEDVRITVMCDVDNPLYGPTGAVHVFGRQKGADAAMITQLDQGLRKLDAVMKENLGVSVADVPGTGAGGGMGAGCMAFLHAELKPGIECVLDTIGFDAMLEDAELVITGEGRIDSQSVHGKVISGIAKRTRLRGIPLIALVGGIAEGAEAGYDLGVTAMFGIDRSAQDFHAFASDSAKYYQRTLEDILRLIAAVKG